MADKQSNLLTNDPTVSIIMNCLNGEKYLREAIDSVFGQTFDDWEIIFWEDVDSTDSSGDIAKSYGSKLRYFKADEKLPLYGARNLALQKARGKFIAILDCDDLWLPTKLEEQIPLFEEDSEVGLVCSDAILFDEKGKEKRLFAFKKPRRGNLFPELLMNHFIIISAAVVRKKAFDSLDFWFDSRLKMTGDTDAWRRISYKWKNDYIDKPLVKYRIHNNNMTWNEGRKLAALEADLTIENLKKTIHKFESKYPDIIRILERKRDVNFSLLDWERGNKKTARKRVRRYMHDSIIHFVLYFLMYLPYKFTFYPCYRLYNKDILK
ncbi:MAG: glycosyltransferase family 2 protein [Thermodesulfobacteriota bacterium]